MNISIIGTGYVGLVSGVGFASKGHDVTCVDIIEEKVKMINQGKPPIYEKGLDDLLKEVVEEGRLTATTDTVEAIKKSDITFICVGTPSREDGSIDTSGIEKAAKDIREALDQKDAYHVVCVKSTVVPGTTDQKVLSILEQSGKKVGEDFGLGMNPEFLREGVALDDFLKPDRIVIGGWDERCIKTIKECYEGFEAPKLETNIRTAEMIKYASNALLATKISFANEMSRIAEKMGVDVYDVMDGVGLDHRINRDFLNAGCGFGGSCFPKDVKAILDQAEKHGVDSKILKAVLDVNETQPIHTVELLEENIGDLEGKHIAVLGLAFKGGTDDIRETRALPIVNELLDKGADVVGYDPEAIGNFSELVADMKFADDIEEALTGADACIIQNDWPELKTLSSKDFEPMNNKIILDARRLLEHEELDDDIEYIGIGLGK
ncbi:MAG: UDP-glucose dehydrogenase family protein [Thermoplasmata archaeon]